MNIIVVLLITWTVLLLGDWMARRRHYRYAKEVSYGVRIVGVAMILAIAAKNLLEGDDVMAIMFVIVAAIIAWREFLGAKMKK